MDARPIEPGSARGKALADTLMPAEMRIVDRWLAADGSNNVVVELPNGQTLCGRAEPWDPLRPLVEHVMAYRPCGRGRTRTFSVPADARPGYRLTR